jgi:hypothetical protein
MFQTLYTLLVKSVGALRGIADLHPAVFSVSDWSGPQSSGGAQHRRRISDAPAMGPEIQDPSASAASRRAPAAVQPRTMLEPRLAERAAHKLIVK